MSIRANSRKVTTFVGAEPSVPTTSPSPGLLVRRVTRGKADGIFPGAPKALLSLEVSKIDRLMPIVIATKQIVGRGISRLKSKAQISDGSARRFFVVRRKTLRC